MHNPPNYSLDQLYKKCLEAVNLISGSASEISTEKYLQEIGFFNKGTTYLNAVYGIMDMSNLYPHLFIISIFLYCCYFLYS